MLRQSNKSMENENILVLNQVTKTYKSGDRVISVLHDVSLDFSRGSSCALVGPSGSGKTTFLSLCAGLERQDSGSVQLCGERLEELSEDRVSSLRNREVGFVLQTFQLFPTLSALENVMVPAELRGRKNARDEAWELLRRVGLGDRAHHYPAQLSGGEQQRVAIARAYINHPSILFADEPTGNLDAENAEMVEALLFEMRQSFGTTLLIATHNLALAQMTEQQFVIRGGKLSERE